ncbi:unnamed protein product [Rhizophagus irregularis]|nr:unnamed protein product [Rhizophagus irregularis]
MKFLKELIDERVNKEDIDCFDYNEFRNLEKIDKKIHGTLKANWEKRRITVVLKILNNSQISEGDFREFISKHACNVLVNNGIIIITDLRLLRQTVELTSENIAYVEPQYLRNPSYELDMKSDIYSLGVLLWELSSGRPPLFEYIQKEFDLAQVKNKLINGEREKPIIFIPSEYLQLYQKCWQDDPNMRHEINEVYEILSRIKLQLSQLSSFTSEQPSPSHAAKITLELFNCSTQQIIKQFKLNHGLVLNGEPSVQAVIAEDGELEVNLYKGQPLVYTYVNFKNTSLDTCINFPVAEIIYKGNLLESFIECTNDKKKLHKLHGDFLARRFLAGDRLFIENFKLATTVQANILKFYLLCVYNSVKYSTEIQLSELVTLDLLPKLVTSDGKKLNTREELTNWMNNLNSNKIVNIISYDDLILISRLKHNTSLVDESLETLKEKQPGIANFREKLSLEEWVGDAVNDNLMSWTRDFNLFRGLIINKNDKIKISRKIPINIVKIPEVNHCNKSYLKIIRPSTNFELALVSNNIFPNEHPSIFPPIKNNANDCELPLIENNVNNHEPSTFPLIENNVNNFELSTLPLIKSNINNHELSSLPLIKSNVNDEPSVRPLVKSDAKNYGLSTFPLVKNNVNNYEGYDHVIVKSEKYEILLNMDDIKPTKVFEQVIEEALNSMKPLKALQDVFNEYGHLFSQRIILGGSLRNILPNLSSSDDVDDVDDIDEMLESLNSLDISRLLTRKGRIIETNDLHDWIQNTNNHLEITKFDNIIPLYKILKENQQRKINDILINNYKIIITGITDLTGLNNDNDENYKRINFGLSLESEDYEVFGLIISETNTKLEEIYINFGLYDFNGFYAIIKKLEETSIDITKCYVSWVVIGNPSQVSVFSPNNRELQVDYIKKSIKLQPNEFNYDPIETSFTLHKGYTFFAHANHSSVSYENNNIVKLVEWKERSINVQIESACKIQSNASSSNSDSDHEDNACVTNEVDLRICILSTNYKSLKVDNAKERECPLDLIGHILSEKNFNRNLFNESNKNEVSVNIRNDDSITSQSLLEPNDKVFIKATSQQIVNNNLSHGEPYYNVNNGSGVSPSLQDYQNGSFIHEDCDGKFQSDLYQSTKQNILPNIPQDKELPPIPNTIYPNTRTINNDNSNSLSLYIYNRYELISQISKSKHNKVYLGRHILTSDKIVVKFYKSRSRWENEIHFLKALTSKYTVKLEEITVNPAEEQKYFIITRYFGKSLDEIANNICDNEAHIKSVLLGTCKAVEWCHNKGVVHMDLNPSNIICKDQKIHKIQLCDFEYSKNAGDNIHSDKYNQPLQLGFTSPELLFFQQIVSSSASHSSYSPSSYSSTTSSTYYTTKDHPETLLVKQSIDIFSLGCIFYFLNKTHLLYNSEKQLEQLNLTKVCEDIDDEQVSILVKCMVAENDSKRPSITQILENPYLKN